MYRSLVSGPRNFLSLLLLFIVAHGLSAQSAARGKTALDPAAFPIAFEANRGQADAAYSYVFHRDGMVASFRAGGIDFVLPGAGRAGRAALHLELMGSSAAAAGKNLLTAHSNYLIGNDATRWVRNVPLYNDVEYGSIYPGISLDFYGNGRELEHDFRVKAGADPTQIAFRFAGADGVSIADDGDLRVRVGDGTLLLHKPVAYQMIDGVRHGVDASFVVEKNGAVRFALGDYDAGRELVIDPVLSFSTYLAGNGEDMAYAVTTDSLGYIYVTGSTSSTNFPTLNAYQSAYSCGSSCVTTFVTKLDPTGSTLVFSTYLGDTSGSGTGYALTVDSNRNVIVVGTSFGTTANFPQTGSLPSYSCNFNDQCYYIASLATAGSTLNYSGLIAAAEFPNTNYETSSNFYGAVTTDSSGNAYIAGATFDTNFPVTSGTLSSTVPGGYSNIMFVKKISSTGAVVYSTVVPGTITTSLSADENSFFPYAIAVDTSGDVTVAGSGGAGLPVTSGVIESQFPYSSPILSSTGGDATAGFVLQLNPTASAINYASYLTGADTVGGMAIDASGNMYFAGTTSQTTLPTTGSSYQQTPLVSTTRSEIQSGYILKVSSGATSALAATYLGGLTPGTTTFTSLLGIALDSNSNVYVGGSTGSSDFPLVNPITTQFNVYSDNNLVLAELNPGLSSLLFGSYLNAVGVNLNSGTTGYGGIAVDPSNNFIVTGSTSIAGFPTTSGGYDPTVTASSNPHAFVSKISMGGLAPAACFDNTNPGFGDVVLNSTGTTTIHITNCGNAMLDVSSVVSSAPAVTVALQNCASVAPNAVCTVTFSWTPTAGDTLLTAAITVTDNATPSTVTMQMYGVGVQPAIFPPAYTITFEGSLAVGLLSSQEPLTISNHGNAPLTISAVTLSNGNVTIDNDGCVTTLAVGGECFIYYQFSPQAVGSVSGSINIASNDPVTPVDVITIAGTGAAPFAVGTGTSGSTSATVAPGSTATYNLALTAASGFNGAVSLTCTGAPTYATCSISPTSLTLASGTASPFTVTVTTTTTVASLNRNSIVMAGFGMLALLTMPLVYRRRIALRLCLFIVGAILLTTGISGCGGGTSSSSGGSQTNSTTAGTYTLTVTGTTATGVTVTQPITLIVN